MSRCCKYCKIPIPEKGKKEYCTKYCKQLAEKPPCPVCGSKFLSECSSTYCSNECKHIALKYPTEWKSCEWCGEKFEIDRVRRGRIKNGTDSGRFCSRECAFAWRSDKPENAPSYMDGRSIQIKRCNVYFNVCKQCKILFSARRPEKVYCSASCRQRYFRKNDKLYREKADARARCRRAQKRSVVIHDDINIKKLHKRDKGICRICGERVDMRRKWPHPLSASIDHVIPLSNEGLHAWDNVQLAHLRCNMKKGDKAQRQRQRSFSELMREGKVQ